MMTKQELQELEKLMMEELVKRRRLGGFDANADTILVLSEVLYKVVNHMASKETKKQ